eukprot:12657906-Heterocapsa_arctica.AAC.1
MIFPYLFSLLIRLVLRLLVGRVVQELLEVGEALGHRGVVSVALLGLVRQLGVRRPERIQLLARGF